VKGISFSIERGEIYGLLGANGAGKTTVIKMLCGLQKPSEGSVSVLGSDPFRARQSTHARIGYMNQKFSLYDGLTVEENIGFYAWTYGIPLEHRKARVAEALDQLDLPSVRKEPVGQLPRGLKQRVAFAASTIHNPDILFLDEPTAGTDPLTRRRMWSLTNAIAASGATVLVTTHFLDEAEFCNRIACMVAGNIVAQGSPSEIKRSCQRQVLSVHTDSYEAAVRALSKQFAPWRLSVAQNQVRILSDNAEADFSSVEQLLKQASIVFDHPQKDECTLEDAFISYVADYGGDES
jgi:ABC-2 type transport system ATP-binding protein